MQPNVRKTLLILLLAFTGCATISKDLDLSKLKETERLYTGQIQVDLNGQKNDQLRCDFFLNTDFGPTFELEKDGFVFFKSPKKNLTISEIVCVAQMDKKSIWVKHTFDFKKIPQPENSNQVTYFGNINIHWNIDFNKLEKKGTSFGDTEAQIKNVGTFNVQVSSDFTNHQNLLNTRFPDLKAKNMSHSETLFTVTK